MKQLGTVVVCLLVLAGTAVAQTPIAADGGVGRTPASTSAPSLVFPTSTTPGSVYVPFGTSFSYGGSPFFDVAYVIEFDMTGQPNVASAYLQFTVSNYYYGGSGTFVLSAMTGVNENGTVNGADHPSTASLTFVGSTVLPAGFFGTISFPVTAFVNFDVNAARPYSGYVLRLLSPRGGVGTSAGAFSPQLNYTAVPEPGTLALFGLGLFAFAAGHRIRRKRRA